MKILRTILWVLAALGFLIFAIYNWKPVELTLWQNLVMETKLPVLALLAFALGFLPLWAYYQSVKWSMSRRIRALEDWLETGTDGWRTLARAALRRQAKQAAEVVLDGAERVGEGLETTAARSADGMDELLKVV